MNRIALRPAVLAALVLTGIFISLPLGAQERGSREPGSLPETLAPAPPKTEPAPQAPAPISNWQKEHEEQLRSDWPFLAKFKEADLKLGPPAPGQDRVVFMGDSITEGWKIEGPAGYFPAKPYINRGISGQTTPQMLVRFRQDVIALEPKAVAILAGTNDLAGNTGPETPAQIEDNLASMADLATANRIQVVLCSVLPVFDYPWKPGLAPGPKILAINAWMKALASRKGYVYVDYHTAMKDQRDGLPPALSKDGVHPLASGYAVMAPLVEAGIEKALENAKR